MKPSSRPTYGSTVDRATAPSPPVSSLLTHDETGVTLAPADAIRIFRLMCLSRTLEQRLVILQQQNRIPGGVYCGTGNEAVSVVSAYLLRKNDIICPMIRNHSET